MDTANQAQRLDFLVGILAAEHPQAGIPDTYEQKRALLRALMNVRPPKPIDPRWLEVQDAFLRTETAEKSIVDVNTLPVIADDPRLILWQGDITRLNADAIVNAANSALLGCFIPNHVCIDNVIHSSAGFQLRLACKALIDAQGGQEATGRAKITPAFNLPSRYVLHTVGPIVSGALSGDDCRLLASCYRACLGLAAQYKLTSVAFCCVSTGEFHFPNEKATQIAVDTVRAWLDETRCDMKVVFDVFKDRDHGFYRRLLGEDRGAQGAS